MKHMDVFGKDLPSFESIWKLVVHCGTLMHLLLVNGSIAWQVATEVETSLKDVHMALLP